MRYPRSFSFGGAMYAWPFLCGVASYIQDHGLLADDARVYAISAGSMAAVLLVCGVDIEQVGLAAGLACNDEHATGRLLPYLRPDAVRSSLDTFASVFPRDAHERASGRLFLGVTELPRFRKRLISQFRTRIALIGARQHDGCPRTWGVAGVPAAPHRRRVVRRRNRARPAHRRRPTRMADGTRRSRTKPNRAIPGAPLRPHRSVQTDLLADAVHGRGEGAANAALPGWIRRRVWVLRRAVNDEEAWREVVANQLARPREAGGPSADDEDVRGSALHTART